MGPQRYCKNGHELTPENTVRHKSRNRHECRICCNERRKRKYLQAKGTIRPFHGKARTQVYRAWQNLKQRVKSQRTNEKRNYFDRGISVGFDSFEAFYREIGDPPGPAYSLDRINGERGYETGNVRWATKKEQGENRFRGWRNHAFVCKRGHKMTYSKTQKRYHCYTCRNEQRNRRRQKEKAVYGRRLH